MNVLHHGNVSDLSQRELERILDASSVAAVLEAIAQICLEKGEHIRTTWQDEPLARAWESAGRDVGRTSTHRVVRGLP